MTTELWLLVAGCAVVTALIKAAGPVAFGGRELPAAVAGVIALMAPALLAALIVTQALAEGRDLGIGADTVGVGLAGLVLMRGASVITGGAVAVGVTVALRALS